MNLRLKLYVSAVAAAAVVLLGLHVPLDVAGRGIHFAAWILICVLSESLWIESLSGSGTVSMASTAGLASAVLWGQGASMWIAALSTLIAERLVQKKPWVRAAFNSAQITLTMWAAALAFALCGGPIRGIESVSGSSTGATAAAWLALPVLALFAVYFLVNRALVAVAVAWSTERPYLRVLREDWLTTERLIEDSAAFLLSPLMVISFRAIGYAGVVLFYMPLRMINESAKRHHDLQSAQKQLIHTERMAAKGEMAAEISHELRNLLVAISGRAQMLLKDSEKSDFHNVPRNAQIILDQSRNMEVLFKGLMEFSSAELRVERVDLNALLHRTVELVRSQNRFDGVDWDLRLVEPPVELRADPGQLQQVILNLFLNAADAIQEKGGPRKVIGITTSRDDRAHLAALTVSDTGTGIAASNLSRIFEPHFTTKAEGHGFGLSTSYRIIANHRGKIIANSPSGEGASFHITLPLNDRGGWG